VTSRGHNQGTTVTFSMRMLANLLEDESVDYSGERNRATSVVDFKPLKAAAPQQDSLLKILKQDDNDDSLERIDRRRFKPDESLQLGAETSRHESSARSLAKPTFDLTDEEKKKKKAKKRAALDSDSSEDSSELSFNFKAIVTRGKQMLEEPQVSKTSRAGFYRKKLARRVSNFKENIDLAQDVDLEAEVGLILSPDSSMSSLD